MQNVRCIHQTSILRKVIPKKVQRASAIHHELQQMHHNPKKTPRNRAPIYLASAFGFVILSTIIGSVTHCNDDYFLFYPFPFAIDIGNGPSMLPTMIPLDIYLRDCWSNRFVWMNWGHLKHLTCALFNPNGNSSTADRSISFKRPWQKGDIVTIFNPYSKTLVCKRIVGLEGDRIKVFGEFAQAFYQLYRDESCGLPQDDRYPTPFCQQEVLKQNRANGRDSPVHQSSITVPPNHVWVEGDNPLCSTDSRHYGPLPISSLRGRVTCRIWPIKRDDVSNENNNPNKTTLGCLINNTRPTPFMTIDDMLQFKGTNSTRQGKPGNNEKKTL